MEKINTGFTIIELLIAVAILSVLASISIPFYSKMTRKAIVTTVQHDIAVIRNKLALHEALSGVYPDLVSSKDISKSFNIGATPKFTDNNGTSYEETFKVVATRDNTGGWFYTKSTGKFYANLPSGAYTKDSKDEIWNGNLLKPRLKVENKDEVAEQNGPVGESWETFTEKAIKENSKSYGSITFNYPDEHTISPQEWHGNDGKYWEKVFIYDENKNFIINPNSEDGSYNYKEKIKVDRGRDKKYSAVLGRTNPKTGEQIYLYNNPKPSGW